MLFTESQLQMGTDPFIILDEATYLTEAEATLQPQMVPVIENSRLQSYVIDFNSIRHLSEQWGIDYTDAIVSIAEAGGINLDDVCIAIDEADIIEHPELSTIGPIVVTPLSEDNPEYVLTEYLLEQLMMESEDWDETTLTNLLLEMSWNSLMKELNVFRDKHGFKNADDEKLWRQMARFAHPDMHIRDGEEAPDSAVQKVKDAIKKMGGNPIFGSNSSERKPPGGSKSGENNSGAVSKIAGLLPGGSKSGGSGGSGMQSTNNPSGALWTKLAMAGIGAAIGGGLLDYNQYRNKPKSVIAKRIAALRQTYAKFMQRSQSAPNEGIRDRLKHVAAKILGVIDKLMSFLQRKADYR